MKTLNRYEGLVYFIAKQNHASTGKEAEGDGCHYHVWARVLKQPKIKIITGLDWFFEGKSYHPNIKQGFWGRHYRYLSEPTEKKPKEHLDPAPLTNVHQDQMKFAGLTGPEYKRAQQIAMMEDRDYMQYLVREQYGFALNSLPAVKKGYEVLKQQPTKVFIFKSGY